MNQTKTNRAVKQGLSDDPNGMMKNGEHKDCEKHFEQVQMLAEGTVGQITN